MFFLDADDADEMIDVYLSEITKILRSEHFYNFCKNFSIIEAEKETNQKTILLLNLFLELQNFVNVQKGKFSKM